MASNIKFKRSAVQNRVPTTSQLDLGELALNTYDGKLYTEINTGSAAVVEIGSKLSSLVVDGDNGGGGGDVVFHGTTANRDLTWDYSDNSLLLPDDVKLKIGSSADLQLYHDFSGGSENSHIAQTTSKHLLIDANTSFIRVDSTFGVTKLSNSHNIIRATAGSDVKLYFNNAERITTTADGADIGGTGSLKIPVGTTAQRSSSPTAGDLRYNTTTSSFEGYSTDWGDIGAGGIGVGSDASNPNTGIIQNRVGVGFTDLNIVGAGISVTGYGTTVFVDFNEFKPGSFHRTIHNYTATAGQTTFGGLNYVTSEKQIAVYLNGARLSEATYTATSGTTVVLDVGASVGDEVEIINIHTNSDVDRKVNTYTATAGQTTFTGLSYNSKQELDVFLNGIRLASADFTATSGNTVVLAVGASVNDIIDIVSTGDGVTFRSTSDASGDRFTFNNLGIGTDQTPDALDVRGNVNVVGVMTATTLHGDGSNLTGITAGATLSEPSSGTQRLVTTSQTTGSMTSSSTGSELAFDYSNNLLEFSDGTKASFGTDNDLQIWHTSGYNFIDAATGSAGFFIRGRNNTTLQQPILSIRNDGNTEDIAKFTENAGVQLYHDNLKKFETTSTGVEINSSSAILRVKSTTNGNDASIKMTSNPAGSQEGTITYSHVNAGVVSGYFEGFLISGTESNLVFKVNGAIAIPDSGTKGAKLLIGSSQDLEIYHDGSHSYIHDGGTGNLKVRSNNFRVSNADESKVSATFVPSGAVELYHNNLKKLETTTYGIDVTGTTGTDGLAVSGISTFSSDLLVPTSMDSTDAGGVAIQRFWSFSLTNGNIYKCGHWHEGEGAVQLLISVRSITGANSGTTTYIFQGGFRALDSTGNNDGPNSTYHRRLMPLASGSGHGNGADQGLDSSGGWELLINQVTAYTYGVVLHVPSGRTNKSLQVTVTELNRGNTFTDQSSSAAYSSITENSNPILPSSRNYIGTAHLRDFSKINFGNSDDLQIYHSSSDNNSFIDSNTAGSQILIRTKETGGTTNNAAKFMPTGAVELYFDGSKKFETTSGGAKVTGDLVVDGNLTNEDVTTISSVGIITAQNGINVTGGNINLGDSANTSNHRIFMGADNDMFMYHNGTHGVIENTTGNLHIKDDSIKLQNSNSTTRLEVHTSGVTVSGNISVSGTVDGRDLATDGSKLDGIAAGATNVSNTNQLTNGAGFLTSVVEGNIASNAVTGTKIANGSITETKISNNAVTFTKIQDIGHSTIIGRAVGSAGGNPAALTAAQVRAIINVENGATADQSASEILTLIKTVDGAGSGLDADTLDGISSASFLRSDANDTASGRITLTTSDAYALIINSTNNAKIDLRGANDPYIRFREGSTEKAYIQWTTAGMLQFVNQESGEYLRIKTGTNGLTFTHDGTESKVFHAGNDGSGSGLDADTVDGIEAVNLLRSDTSDTMGGSLTFAAGKVIKRADNKSGFFEGLHGSGSNNDTHSNPIYTIGPNYNPALTTLGNMYGIGYTHGGNSSFGPGGAWGMYVAADGDARIFLDASYGRIYINDGNTIIQEGDGNGIRIQTNNGYVDIGSMNTSYAHFQTDRTQFYFNKQVIVNGNIKPYSNNNFDLGDSSNRWANIYVNDLQLSNEAKKDEGGNDVDGTWGNFTIQEGENDLYLINNRNGKKYKFNLTEVQ